MCEHQSRLGDRLLLGMAVWAVLFLDTASLAPLRAPDAAPRHVTQWITTFHHEPDGELLTVTIGTDEIGCTANHPFWSENRQDFVAAGELREGEQVRTRLEQVASVVSIKPRPPTAWVYNLEVQGEHVYEVGPDGVLVHNSCKDIALGRDPSYKMLAQQVGAFHWRQWAAAGITRRTLERLGRAFHHAVKRARTIHFALDGIDDPVQFARLGRMGFLHDAMGRSINFTAANYTSSRGIKIF